MPYIYFIIVLDDSSTWGIDWHFISNVQDHPYHDIKKKSFASIDRAMYNDNAFTDAVVLKSYKMECWKYEKPSFHHVIRISEKTPCSASTFSIQDKTFKGYYKHKYNITIQNDNQKLLETFTNQATVNWKPIYTSVRETFDSTLELLSKSKRRHAEYQEFLIPELCIIHPFPSSFFLQVQYLPTVLFRLNSLLLAEEIRQDVAKCGLVGKIELPPKHSWPSLNFETSDIDLRKHLSALRGLSFVPNKRFKPLDIVKESNNKIASFTREVDLNNHLGPDPSLLLQALTSKSSGDEFDLERLEMIGDSFLKLVISVKTYIKYPLFDEGKLTKMRSRIIQNLHLYQRAKKKKLPEFLRCDSFSCKSTWLPPCYTVDENVDLTVNVETEDEEDRFTKKYFTKQYISDKCIADSVEALIGAYLLSCGQKGALMFMSWLGLNPLPNKTDAEATKIDFLNWPPEPPNVIVGEVANVQEVIAKLTNGFERFERTINYKFKNRALLLQAFTHPSFDSNVVTDCYQRLEFLGDAVLDFLITRQLYEDPKDHSPGKLTDLRSALVNNIYFAGLAVRFEYNKYLKFNSSHLFGLMSHFLEIFEEYFQFFKVSSL